MAADRKSTTTINPGLPLVLTTKPVGTFLPHPISSLIVLCCVVLCCVVLCCVVLCCVVLCCVMHSYFKRYLGNFTVGFTRSQPQFLHTLYNDSNWCSLLSRTHSGCSGPWTSVLHLHVPRHRIRWGDSTMLWFEWGVVTNVVFNIVLNWMLGFFIVLTDTYIAA